MTDILQDRYGVPVLMCDSEGPKVGTAQDALDLIGAALIGADIVAIPIGRLAEEFFSLSTRVAGEIMQKFVNYRIRLAIVGDISGRMEDSAVLRALVYESNRAAHVWFVADVDALDFRLKTESAGASSQGEGLDAETTA